MILLWIGVFIGSLLALLKGSDWLLRGAERIGVHFKLSRFTIGVLIVGVGTSLPELASSISAIFHGMTEIASANVIGSNIYNILFIIGITAIIGKKLTVTKDLMDSELPIFLVATIIFLGVAYDGKIGFVEALLLFLGYLIYLFHTLRDTEDFNPVVTDVKRDVKLLRSKLGGIFLVFFLGLAGVLAGAKFMVDAVIQIAEVLHIAPEIVSLTAVALGTALPELFISIRALKQGKSDIAIGNVFGSNAFNLLMVIGVTGLFSTVTISSVSYTIGLPMLAASTFIFLVFGISKSVYRWEGFMLLVLFAFFILRVLGIG